MRPFTPTDFFTLRGDVAIAKADVLALAGRPDDALAAAKMAIDVYEAKGFMLQLDRARSLVATMAG